MTPVTRFLQPLRARCARLSPFVAIMVVGSVLAACAQLGVEGIGGKPKPINVPPKPSVPASTPQTAQPGGLPPYGSEGQVGHAPSGDRPPMLPSLEALLGSIPRSEDGQILEPPSVPQARGLRVAVILPLSGPN